MTTTIKLYSEETPEAQKKFVESVAKLSFEAWPYGYSLREKSGYLMPFLEKNPNCMGLLSSDVFSPGVLESLAYVSILPVKKEVYEGMISGRIHEYQLDSRDVLSDHQVVSEKDRFFYFQALMKTGKIRRDSRRKDDEKLDLLKVDSQFYKLIKKVVKAVHIEPNCKSITVFAERASDEGEVIMAKYGFAFRGHRTAPFRDVIKGGNPIWVWSYKKNQTHIDPFASLIRKAYGLPSCRPSVF